MKLFLIGFMGAGKSYTGRRLADFLGWSYIDLDETIEQQSKLSITQIFATKGEAVFRTIEQQALRSLQNRDKVVIATGGGTACFADNIDWMNANGLTIYLAATAELLSTRLLNEQAQRPVIALQPEAELLDFVKRKLAEREPFYKQAAIVFKQSGDEDVAKELFDYLPELYRRS